MSHPNKSTPGSVPAKYTHTVLEFTEVERGQTVYVKNRSDGHTWTIDYLQAVVFLMSSYKNYQTNIRLLGQDEYLPNIFKRNKTRVFEGLFPFDQMVMQILGLPYSVYEDQSARAPLRLNGQLFYLALVSEKDWPIIKPEVPREGDVTLANMPPGMPD